MFYKNRLYSFWNIGKSVFQLQKLYDNIIDKISIRYSYKYGMGFTFSRENIKNMKLFYLCFPIYYDSMNKISWDHYLKLIYIENSDKRNFYFKILMMHPFSYSEFILGLENFFYERI